MYNNYIVYTYKGALQMPEEREYKTKDYVRRAQNNYRAKFDQVALKLPKGSKEIIREKTGKSVTTYINELVAKDLKENYGVDIGE